MTSIASVSSSRSPATVAVARPAPPLEAEKAKCESQLSDWVHCVSASTPQGKAKIEELSARLGDIEAEIDKAAATRAETGPVAPPAPGSIVDLLA